MGSNPAAGLRQPLPNRPAHSSADNGAAPSVPPGLWDVTGWEPIGPDSVPRPPAAVAADGAAPDRERRDLGLRRPRSEDSASLRGPGPLRSSGPLEGFGPQEPALWEPSMWEPNDAAPQEAAPQDTAPMDVAPQGAVPSEAAVPQSAVPQDAPEEGLHRESLPRQIGRREASPLREAPAPPVYGHAPTAGAQPSPTIPANLLPNRTPAQLLAIAHEGLREASRTRPDGLRYAAAHLAALRAAAAVLAARARPAAPTRRNRVTSVWSLLVLVAPEFGDWASYFALGATKRAAAEAGIPRVVTAREADDLLRSAEAFVAQVQAALGLSFQPSLEAA
jgi:hypothetical protein